MRNYNNIIDRIYDADNIYIMAHENLDLDALGSMLGLYTICKKYKKKVYIYIEEETEELSVNRAITGLHRRNFKINYINDFNNEEITNKSLLFILDVNKKELYSNKKTIDIFKNIIIIDHHKDYEEDIPNLKVKYIDSNCSSTCQMITYIINHYKIKLEPYIATIMLGGIIVDTNYFSIKTSSKTHLAASLLYDLGADTMMVGYLLKINIDEYKEIGKILDTIKIIKQKYAVLVLDDKNYDKEFLSRISDSLLTFNEIEASFTIGFIDIDDVGISARSLGNIDVEKVMRKLGGGGHKTDAACRIKSLDVDEIYEKLINIL